MGGGDLPECVRQGTKPRLTKRAGVPVSAD
jgi:hypothetical protein